MGLPIDKLVVATNRNDILSRFFQHGDYSARAVQPSLAPAMDIVVPSNFERFLYVLLKQDSQRCKGR
jgi:threonine synthase